MQSRRDQVNAYNYLVSRLTGALVRAEPDVLESPTRRDVRGLVSGIVAAVLLLAVVAGWVLLSARGSTAWRKPGALIVDKSSGSRFLLVDGALRPVDNIASARLLTGSAVSPVVVSGSKLAGVPRGAPVGIANAPDMVPDLRHLNEGVWRLCADPRPGPPAAAAAAGPGAAPAMLVDIGVPASRSRIGADAGLLVSAAGQEYLLWRGQRLLIARPWAADVLGFGAVTPTVVPRTWLDLLPSGPDLAPVPVPGRGKRRPDIGGRATHLGELFAAETASGSVAHYILLPAGLTALSPTQLALARAEAGDAPERPITLGDLAAAARATMPAPQTALPVKPPEIQPPSPGESICVESSADRTRSTVDVVLATATLTPGIRVSNGTAIQVTAGGGALVMPKVVDPQAASTDEAPGVLVDGGGTAYQVTGKAIQALGYAPGLAIASPWKLLAFLPLGPPLTTPGGG
ncbi:MAG: type VII secretion protein EccB [Frankia sp.]